MLTETLKCTCNLARNQVLIEVPGGGGGGVLGPIFVGYVSLVSQNPYPIIVIFYGQL